MTTTHIKWAATSQSSVQNRHLAAAYFSYSAAQRSEADEKQHSQIRGTRAASTVKSATEEEETSSSVLRHMCIF